MKTRFVPVFSVLLALLLALPGAAQASGLPDIDTALENARFSREDRVEIPLSTLEAYTTDSEEEFDFNGLRCLVLERRGAEKAFLESEIPCDDPAYRVQDLDTPRLYLRLDMMRLLPEEMRASSLAEADLLLVAEDEYILSSQIIHTEYENSVEEELPEDLESPEALQQYLAAHPRVPKKRTYKPLFASLALIDIYSTLNGSYLVYDVAMTDCALKCNNPEASNQWDRIAPLGALLDLLETEEPAPYKDAILEKLEGLSDVPENTMTLWKACVEAGEYPTAAFSIGQVYWEQAAALPPLDESPEAAEWYPQLLESRNRQALELFVAFRNYSGIDTPDSVIIGDRLYIGQTDPQWLEEGLKEIIEYLSSL